MSLLRFHFRSIILQTDTTLTITLPELAKARRKLRFPTLYLLHGGSEDSTSWVRLSRVEEYAEEKKLMTVSIDAMSSAYADMAHGGKYFSFLTEEVPRLVRALFPSSARREDTFIAGFSMGGQGALKAAFRRPDLYAAALPISGARDVISLFEKWEKSESGPDLAGVRDALGPINMIRGGENDICALAERLAASDKERPRLFVACGTEDYAYSLTADYHEFLLRLGIEHRFYTAPGIHGYRFADLAIREAIMNWLVIETPSVIGEGE
jgi:putative tributyrin esterase